MKNETYERWATLADRDAAEGELSADERSLMDRLGTDDPAAARETEVWSQLAGLPAAPGGDDEAMRRLVEGALKGASDPARTDEPEPGPEPASPRPRSSRLWWVGGGLLAATAAGLAMWWTSPRPAGPAPIVARAELTFASGDVRIDGDPARVGVGLLEVGSRVEVGNGTACLAVDPGGDLCVSSGTTLSVARLDATARDFRLEAGIAVADLDEQPPGSRFRIETEAGSSTAIGTVFAVEIEARGTATTTVLEGEVSVTTATGSSTSVVIHQRAAVGDEVVLDVVDRSEEARLMAILAPAELWRSEDPGSLHVQAEPERARVSVDGREVGSAPLSTLLPSGRHDVEVSGDGFTPHLETLTIRPGVASELEVRLDAPTSPEVDPAPTPAPNAEAREPIPRDRPQTGAPAKDMLGDARRLMSEGRWRAAARAYERLRAAHPESPEAHAALVTLGDLRLDHLKRPRAALSAYETYLRVGGPMAEEVRFGKIRALRALEDEAEEERAIERFLRRHPGSLEAPDLRQRLAELKK